MVFSAAKAAGAMRERSRTAANRRLRNLLAFCFIFFGNLLSLITSSFQNTGNISANHALNVCIHHAGHPAPDVAVHIDGAAGAAADLRNLDIEPGLFHDPVSQIQDPW